MRWFGSTDCLGVIGTTLSMVDTPANPALAPWSMAVATRRSSAQVSHSK